MAMLNRWYGLSLTDALKLVFSNRGNFSDIRKRIVEPILPYQKICPNLSFSFQLNFTCK